MPEIIEYIIKLNICLVVVYLFYQLFLRRLTFYNWNRWYLLGYTALSFIMPFIDVMPSLQKRDLQQTSVLQYIPAISFGKHQTSNLFHTMTRWDWAIAGLLLISLVLTVRFAIRFLAFIKMKSSAKLISDENTKIYQLNENITPFSFGNAIFINTDLHESQELEEIIKHEFVHVKQKHTIDIIWCELLCILNWFNPCIWLLKKDIKQNLEFIADNKVLQNGVDKKEYQYLLLKVMGNRQFAFTNHFNFSSLKKRIAMMNTIKSAKIQLIKFMFWLPVVAILLLSFRKEIQKQKIESLKNNAQVVKDTLPKEDYHIITSDENFDTVIKKRDVVVVEKIPIEEWNKNKEYYEKKYGKTVMALKKFKDKEINANTVYVTQYHAKPINPETIVIVDGQAKTNVALKELKPEEVERVEIIKGDQAASQYGEKGRAGVIKVTTKPFAAEPENATLKFNSAGGKKPLMVVDGKPVSEWKEDMVNPNDIESINVVKDDASAKSVYGSKAENGVVFITTKNGIKSNNKTFTFKADSLVFKPALKGKVEDVSITAKGKKPSHEIKEVIVVGYSSKESFSRTMQNPPDNAYYVLNGEPVSENDVKSLAADDIKSFSKLNSTEAVKYYGKKAQDGAIVITTK